jgi:hypothetical protein
MFRKRTPVRLERSSRISDENIALLEAATAGQEAGDQYTELDDDVTDDTSELPVAGAATLPTEMDRIIEQAMQQSDSPATRDPAKRERDPEY